jgi:hypothetical protein
VAWAPQGDNERGGERQISDIKRRNPEETGHLSE